MHQYLISYDNGEPYEDHHVSPILIVATEARAKEVIAEMEAWVAETKTKMPRYPDGEVSEEAYEKWLNLDSAFRATLKVPHEALCLVSMVYAEEYEHPRLRCRSVHYLA